MKEQFPSKRTGRLIVREVAGEVLVYDLARDRALCLNQTAAAVWNRCDGRTAPEEIARVLDLDGQAVWNAVDQLGRQHLLDTRIPLPPALAGFTRRRQLRALGKAAAVAIPLVTAVVAPPAAEARTCLGARASCTTSAQCCSGICFNGHCA